MLKVIAMLMGAGFAAQSLLAALGSVQFVSNVFFASFVLKEKVSSDCAAAQTGSGDPPAPPR
jgi:hypothetical protein